MQTSTSVGALSLNGTVKAYHFPQSSSSQSTSSENDLIVSSSRDNANRIFQLERELIAARNSIAEQEAKCNRLSDLQNQVDSEVQELTEKLFQEAYKMVNEAEERRIKAEKLLSESLLKVDMLSAEVEALKVIVKSPKAQMFCSVAHKSGLASRLLNTPNRRENDLRAAFIPNIRKSFSLPRSSRDGVTHHLEEVKKDAISEIDPIYHREFASWKEQGAPLNEPSLFLNRIMSEEVTSCLNFDSNELADQVLSAIRMNTLELEPVAEEKAIVRICALTQIARFCPYRLRVNSDSEWFFVSLLARNRIASVCDFFTYVRYIHQGIVKSELNDSYWDVIHLRKNMNIARLGLGFVPKTGGR